jgi:hypothetical protein
MRRANRNHERLGLDTRVIKGKDEHTVTVPIGLPTLPAFTALGGASGDRLGLLGGLGFIESSTSGWGPRELLAWFTTYGPALGRSGPPASVTEGVVGTIPLGGAKITAERLARLDELPKLLAMARWRVVVSLRGMVASPPDDRFLQAAIFAGRVRREQSLWVARPQESDTLGDIVLSLFVADILTNRDFHEQNLCVCEVCGRVSYSPQLTTRTGCTDHAPGTEVTSGFQRRAGVDSAPPASTPGRGGVTPRR